MKKAAKKTRLARLRAWISQRYMRLDPRTLALFRIVIGALLCADCLRHWSFARRYYSNSGVLTNHWHLFAPSSGYNFSLFHAFSTPEEVHVAFALAFACYFLFAVGFKTRLFSVLACVWVTSMDNRLVMVENGGYIVVNLAVFWGMFLPLGRRFSVDAWLREWRQRPPRSLSDLNAPIQRDTRPYVSLLSFVIVLNFALIYIFNVVNKYGSTWRTGKTAHFVMHIDRMVTLPAVWLRETLPFALTQVASWTVLVVEALIVVTLLWPSNRLRSRPTAWVLIVLLHTSFGILMRLGPFSWFMIGFATITVMACHWEWLSKRHARRAPAVELTVPLESGVGWWVARMLRSFDITERLAFAEGPLFRCVADGSEVTGTRAIWRAVSALPLGTPAMWLARIATLGGLDRFVARAVGHPGDASRFWGMSAPPRGRHIPHEERSPGASRWLRRLHILHEAAILYLVFCAASQTINENKAIPKVLKHTPPKFVTITVTYPRIFQGWGMFAPNPIREDGVLAVDAITMDGRHIDPFTGDEPDLNLSDARGTGLDQIEQDYFNRIRLDQNKGYRRQLERWITRYHLETERPEDRIVFFNVYWLQDHNPEPGMLEPTEHEMFCIHSYKERGYRPEPPLPKLPRKCKVVSADKKDEEEAPKKDQVWWKRALTL